MIDVMIVPKRFKQHVAKPNSHQVLHGLFAKVMVDAVNLAFIKMLRQRRVQRFGRRQIAAKRLFNNHAAAVIGNVECVQPFGQIPKQAGRDREVKGVDDLKPDQIMQFIPAAIALGVHRDVVQLGQEPFDAIGLRRFIATKFRNGFADHLAVAITVNIGPCSTDYACAIWHLS